MVTAKRRRSRGVPGRIRLPSHPRSSERAKTMHTQVRMHSPPARRHACARPLTRADLAFAAASTSFPIHPPVPIPRIYADFNGIGRSRRDPSRWEIPLDSMGSLKDLTNAGIRLRPIRGVAVLATLQGMRGLSGGISYSHMLR